MALQEAQEAKHQLAEAQTQAFEACETVQETTKKEDPKTRTQIVQIYGKETVKAVQEHANGVACNGCEEPQDPQRLPGRLQRLLETCKKANERV